MITYLNHRLKQYSAVSFITATPSAIGPVISPTPNTPFDKGLPRYSGVTEKGTGSNHLMRTAVAEDLFSEDINDLHFHTPNWTLF